MVVKERWPLVLARLVAEELVEKLEDVCERIEIAGSMRREVFQVGDIEIVCIPKFRERFDLFGEPVQGASLLDERCVELARENILEYRPNARGAVIFGPLNKLLVHQPTGMPVDIFSTTADNWGMTLAVRTGPKTFCIRMMRRFRDLGFRGHPYGGVTRGRDEYGCPTEEQLFELLGWDYLAPGSREPPRPVSRSAKRGGKS